MKWWQWRNQLNSIGVLVMTNPDGGATFGVPTETKRIPIDPEFPERKAIIGAGLDEK